MCKVIYRAEDGTEFTDRDTCRKYSEAPHVWVVTKISPYYNNRIKLFTHKEQATDYAATKNNAGHYMHISLSPSTYIVTRYNIEA